MLPCPEHKIAFKSFDTFEAKIMQQRLEDRNKCMMLCTKCKWMYTDELQLGDQVFSEVYA